MIALDAISKGFGGRLLLREASWRIGRGERIGLVGPNGAGKTTLCRILAGEEPPDAGHVHRDTGVSVGYLPQDVGGHEAGTVLAEALSGFEEVWPLDEPTNHLDIESLQWLEGFLSSYEGSVVVVSHDRYFLNRMVTSIAEVADGAITLYVGDYDHFLVEREARQALLEARARNQAK